MTDDLLKGSSGGMPAARLLSFAKTNEVQLMHVASGKVLLLSAIAPNQAAFCTTWDPSSAGTIGAFKRGIDSGSLRMPCFIFFEETAARIKDSKSDAWYFDAAYVPVGRGMEIKHHLDEVPAILEILSSGEILARLPLAGTFGYAPSDDSDTDEADDADDGFDEEEGDNSESRTSQEAAKRLLALMAVVGRTHEVVATRGAEWVKRYGIDGFFSSEEKQFFYLPEKPPEGQVINFSWRAEAMVSLIWALGGFGEMPPLDKMIPPWDTDLMKEAVRDPVAFLQNAKLRDEDEIAEMEQTLYHAHWQVRDAQLFKKPMPAGLHGSIVYERRYALSWLVGYGDDWDDVPTDT